MNTSLLRLLTAALALLFVVSACAGDTAAEWTFAPVVAEDGAEPEADDEGAQAEGTEPDEPDAVLEEDDTPVTDLPDARVDVADTVDPDVDAETGEGPVTEEDIPPADVDAEAGETDGDVVPVATAMPAGDGEADRAGTGDGEAEPGETGDGEARVIEIFATAAIEFTDADGVPISEIAVTPGETVTFRVENTAGFGHNFTIGEPDVVSQAEATTDTGIPTFSEGVEELTWVVPEDAASLQFACTVTGHYTRMHGDFTIVDDAAPEAEATMAPADDGAVAGSPAPDDGSVPVATTAPSEEGETGEARVIEMLANNVLQFTTPDGERLEEIAVTPGETILFRVDNTAGFTHNLYIGEQSQLTAPSATTDVGIPDWDSGVQELEWVVPDDVSGLQFACTVPGHYSTMHGDFVLAP